jgi:hypothetical protein
MSTAERTEAERTYKAIGRFIYEFSQVEYTIRYYLAERIGLHEEYFSAVIESYDVALLIAVAKQVFKKSIHPGAISAPFLQGPPPPHIRNRQPQVPRPSRGEQIEKLLNRLHKFPRGTEQTNSR